jgi:hypothetical protein
MASERAEWEEEGGNRGAGKFTFEDIHRKIFGKRMPKRRSFKEMREGIAEHVRERYART